MFLLSILLFFGWAVWTRSISKNPLEVDLVWERPQIDAYEVTTADEELTFWEENLRLFRIRPEKTHNEA